ncbi:MAG: hypothetical protein AABY55_04160 [Candidatus Omnitrophota bacterium]
MYQPIINMESGFFYSSRKKILFWCLGPILTIVIAYSLSYSYFKSARLALEEQIGMVELMPILEKKLDRAKKLIQNYNIMTSGLDSVEMLDTEINSIAANSNFTINSLAIEKRPIHDPKSGISIYDLKVKGEGELPAIIGFFNTTYKTNRLFSLENMKLLVADRENTGYYKADLEFSYCAVKLVN